MNCEGGLACCVTTWSSCGWRVGDDQKGRVAGGEIGQGVRGKTKGLEPINCELSSAIRHSIIYMHWSYCTYLFSLIRDITIVQSTQYKKKRIILNLTCLLFAGKMHENLQAYL